MRLADDVESAGAPETGAVTAPTRAPLSPGTPSPLAAPSSPGAPSPLASPSSSGTPSSATAPDARGPRADADRKAEFEANKVRKRLRRLVGQAIGDFGMIVPGDRVMVCVSGGKDSFGLLDILLSLKDRAPLHFEVVAVNLDQKQPGFPAHVLPDYLRGRGIPFHIEERDTYSIVKRLVPEGRTMCSLCSRLRRGNLYRVATELGCTKIALGHHRDDILATFFLNLFFAARIKAMPPKLVSDDGRHVVIRPLAYVRERDLTRFATQKGFPIIPCNLCGSQENLQRRQISQMLRDWESRHPGRVDTIFNAMQQVVPSHLLDRRAFDFAGVRATFRPEPDGDIAFDEDEACSGTSAATGAPDPLPVVRFAGTD